ncbi:MAG TPA: PRC-barrel domain-containing protein [Solirubrobacterales bacterium]
MPEESWLGYGVDDADGSRVGSVQGYYVDAGTGKPAWLVAGLGRRRVKPVAIPIAECAAGAGRVWVAQRKDALRSAPTVDPRRPLLREHEIAICAHYGIGERVGRSAEVTGRDEGAVTARPA